MPKDRSFIQTFIEKVAARIIVDGTHPGLPPLKRALAVTIIERALRGENDKEEENKENTDKEE